MPSSGEEGYEGLSAVIVVSPDGTAVWEFEDVIFPGPMPEYPPPMPPAEVIVGSTPA